ncbi:PKD domain-containing protein, partial [bacterium]|nr:PKD domain-containing protein [bacterium]MBU4510513.1 PKD domain-containing protein [bacterium]
MNFIKSLKLYILILILVFLIIFPGCGGITTPGISQDTLNAVITISSTSGEAPLEVTFDASESSAAQWNEIVSYEWDFGDGKTGEGETVQHGFDSAGSYTVILTISDNKGAVDTSSVIIKVLQPTETVKEQTFNAQDGTEFDTGTGLKVSISPVSTVGKAKLVVAENYSLQQLGEGLIKLLSVYSISLVQESISQGQKMDKESSEGPLNVELMFDIPPGTDPNSVAILEWTDEGWVLASSSDSPDSIDSLGGVLASDGHNISIELHHLSTYALSRIEFTYGEPVIIPHDSEPLITTDGDICIDVLLESPHWGIISAGAWYQIEVVGRRGFKSVKSLTDPSFGDWGENKGFLGPKENKKLQFTFWGTGGTADIYFSVRDGWPMALRDYLVRVVGKNLDWPYPSREAMENDFIKKCGIGIVSTAFSESVNKLGDELIKVTSIQDGVRSLWKWMRKYGIGNWIRFITTSKLAVDTVGHIVLNQGGYIHYRLIGGILHPLVKVNPAEVVINAGESVQFSASLTTFDGNQVLSTDPSSKWNWEVSGGGSIDGNGLFTADNNTFGTYTIKARTEYFYIDGDKHKVEGEANVIINVTGSSTIPPDPPTPLSPGTTSAPGPTIDTLTPTLQWQTVSDADYYALAISEYPYGLSYVIYNPQKIYGDSITVPNGVLEAGKKYRWNMQSYNSNSALLSDISNTLYFQILPSNYPPVITSTPVTSATKDEPYSYDVNATDADGDTRTYSLATTKPSGMIINSSTGLITWMPTAIGDYNVTVEVSDGIAAVTQSFTITVTLVTPETYTITASAGSNGSISPSGNVTVNQGTDKSFTITPDTGYQIDDVLVDGGSIGAISSYTFINVTENHTISATFKSIENIILNSITVSPSTMSLIEGDSQTISSITAHYSDGSTADIALDDCAISSENPGVALVDTEGVIRAVSTGIATIRIIYVENFIDKTDSVEVTVTSVAPETYTITASAGSNGSISPSGNVTVNQGTDKSFTITPDTGY